MRLQKLMAILALTTAFAVPTHAAEKKGDGKPGSEKPDSEKPGSGKSDGGSKGEGKGDAKPEVAGLLSAVTGSPPEMKLTIRLGDGNGKSATVYTTAATAVTVNGKAAQLKDIHAGQRVKVSGENNTVTKIDATTAQTGKKGNEKDKKK